MKTIHCATVLVSLFAGVSLTASALAQAAPPPLPPVPPGVNPRAIQAIPAPTLVQPLTVPAPVPAPAITIPAPVVPAAPANPNALVWDAEMKEASPAIGEATANYTFWFTNTSSKEVVINAVRTSCGCTSTKLPTMPWHIPPGTNSPIEVSLDLRGKAGVISKAVTVDSTAGIKSLIIKVNIPGAAATQTGLQIPGHPMMNDVDRLKNMQAALADRQVVFKDAKCATCHADPAKTLAGGPQLYTAVCGICHDSVQRAALVPDLKAPKHETDIDYWKQWITYGKAGSMMPAFGKADGGPLSEQQIAALADYCVKTFQPVHAVVPAPAPAPAPAPTTNAAIQINPQPKTN